MGESWEIIDQDYSQLRKDQSTSNQNEDLLNQIKISGESIKDNIDNLLNLDSIEETKSYSKLTKSQNQRYAGSRMTSTNYVSKSKDSRSSKFMTEDREEQINSESVSSILDDMNSGIY